jgi:hypothetical protein
MRAGPGSKVAFNASGISCDGWSLRGKQVATGEIGELDIVEHVMLLAFSSLVSK